HYQSRVKSIHKDGSKWVVFDGEKTYRFDRLVSAFPIHHAVKCFHDVPAEVHEALRNLRYNALRLVFLAVNNTSLMDKSAVYIPDPAVHPHRVCYMGFFSPNLVRPGTSSLVAETTVRPGLPDDQLSESEFIELVAGDLERAGILRKEDIIVSDHKRIEYAYPVYDGNYAKNVATLKQYFASLGVEQLGRFAEFDYINSDECIHRAMKMADRLNAMA